MEDPDGLWRQARWLERRAAAIARLVELGVLTRPMAAEQWTATVAAVEPEAVEMAARVVFWRREQEDR